MIPELSWKIVQFSLSVVEKNIQITNPTARYGKKSSKLVPKILLYTGPRPIKKIPTIMVFQKGPNLVRLYFCFTSWYPP